MTEVTWPEEKRCSHCKHLKPASEFNKHVSGKDGLSSRCKTCASVINKNYRETTEGRLAKRRAVLKGYGLTPEDYDRMFIAQGGKCAICNRKPAKNRHLSVDHDHSCCSGVKTCGKCVRGLLCDTCNRKTLGYWLQESTKGTGQALATARRLVAYLERSEDGRARRAA